MQPDVSLMWKIKEKPFTIMSLWFRKCFNFVFFKEEKIPAIQTRSIK